MDEEAKKPFLKYCDGVPVPSAFSEETVKSAISYKPKKGDVFVVSYPKCGSTWTQNIVLLILRHGKLASDPLDFMLGCPFLEVMGAEAVDYIVQPGAIKTHLPYSKVPKSQEAKYIYVMRDPKDCAVSFYYHMKQHRKSGFEEKTFDEYFEYFVRGELPFGNYFDHIVEWYEHRNDPNVYIVIYESLKRDSRGEVLKLARFLGEQYEKVLLDNPKSLEDVLHYSSFEFMKKDVNEKLSKWAKGEMRCLCEGRPLPSHMVKRMKEKEEEREDATGPKKDKPFQLIRKGIIGDWKNHLKPSQIKKLEEIIAEKTKNSEVMNLWKQGE